MVTVVRQCVGDSERGIRGREGGGHCSLENLTSWPSASKRERERERGGGGGGGGGEEGNLLFFGEVDFLA